VKQHRVLSVPFPEQPGAGIEMFLPLFHFS
jgi:hypothetical protein